jgi:hypothetical protein
MAKSLGIFLLRCVAMFSLALGACLLGPAAEVLTPGARLAFSLLLLPPIVAFLVADLWRPQGLWKHFVFLAGMTLVPLLLEAEIWPSYYSPGDDFARALATSIAGLVVYAVPPYAANESAAFLALSRCILSFSLGVAMRISGAWGGICFFCGCLSESVGAGRCLERPNVPDPAFDGSHGVRAVSPEGAARM